MLGEPFRGLILAHIVLVAPSAGVYLDTAFRDFRVDEVEGTNLAAASDRRVGRE